MYPATLCYYVYRVDYMRKALLSLKRVKEE